MTPKYTRHGHIWIPTRRDLFRAGAAVLASPWLLRAASYTYVNHTGGGIGTTGNPVIGPMSTVGCDLLVLILGSAVGGGALTIYSDTYNPIGNWAFLTEQYNTERVRIAYLKNPVVGTAHSVAIHGGAIYLSAYFAGFSGSNLTAPVDQQNGAASTVTSTTIQPGSITPSVPNELIISGMATGLNGVTPSVDASMTLIGSNQGNGSTYNTCGAAYAIQTAAAAINPTWTVASGNNRVSVIASFKSSSSGGRRRIITTIGEE